jgi:glycerol-3-phosphate dehydrogenase
VPIKIGLMLYDWTTRSRRLMPRHRLRGAAETRRLWPALSRRLRFSATYFDAWISYPERLGVELALDTARLAPESVALNHAKLARRGDGFVLTDGPTGRELPVTPRTIVNATGAWLDESLASLSDRGPVADPFISGTKGSHLILDCPQLYEALGGHMIFFENEDGRVCIIFPYLGRVLAGSTDIRVERADRVRCEPEERDYILDAVREIFPAIEVGAEQVVYSFSGIRPLPRSDHEFTGRIPRGHFIHRLDGEVPQFCMVGGKWTTFRAFAEQTADIVLRELGRARICDTVSLPIGGGADFPASAGELAANLATRPGVGAERAAWLVDAYGTRAGDVLAFCAGRGDDTRLDGYCPITSAEIGYLVQSEFAARLEDILVRRTPLAIRGELSTAIVERVADVLAAELGWSAERRSAEIETFIRDLADYHGVSREMLERRTRERSDACA